MSTECLVFQVTSLFGIVLKIATYGCKKQLEVSRLYCPIPPLTLVRLEFLRVLFWEGLKVNLPPLPPSYFKKK